MTTHSGHTDDYDLRAIQRWKEALDAEDQFSPLAVLRRRRFVILATLMAAIALGALFWVFAPRRYDAKAIMMLDPRLGASVQLDPSQPSFVTEASAIESQVELLMSWAVLRRVAKAENLAADPDFNGQGASLLRGKLGMAGDLIDGVDAKAVADAFSVKRRERTFVIEATASASSPQKAAALANALPRAYADEQMETRRAALGRDAKGVQERLASLQKQMDDADRRIEAYKTKNRIVTSEGLRSNESQIADLSRELGLARARASEAKARLDQLEAAARAGRADIASEALKSLTIERLRSQQADADREVARLAQSLGARHPALLEAQAQAARQRTQIVEELRRIQASAQSDFRSARAHERQLEAAIDRLKARSNDASRANVALTQMEREAATLRAAYDNVAKVRDALVEQQTNAPPARVIAAANPPRAAASPKLWLVVIASVVHGLLIGGGVAMLLEALERARRARQRDQRGRRRAPEELSPAE